MTDASSSRSVASGSSPRSSLRRLEVAGLLAILVLAAITRLPGLDVRGPFDADQGTDMLVLSGLLRGEIPLLGPQTSIGTFHHGAVYYYLLAPVVLLLGPDPVAVMGWIALFGIAAVGATWWLARLLGGPLAALAAGLLAAVSPAGIDESTFIWNPNLIPVASALAFGGALRAWQSGSARWWLLAGAGAMVTMQCHVLGAVVLPPLAGAFLADVRRRRGTGAPLGPLLRAGAGAVLIVAAGYLPLLVHELTHDFAETRAIADYVTGGGPTAGAGIVERVLLVGLRSITWPLTGLITDRPTVSIIVAGIVLALMVAAAVLGRRNSRLAARWLLASTAWSVVALALFAPSLAVIVPGLPNDHYHAFLDPLVLALTGAGLARVAGLRPSGSSAALAAVPRVMAGLAAAVLVVAAVIAWPPAVNPDGGWQAAVRAAAAIEGFAPGEPYSLAGIPAFKNVNSVRFPLELRGAEPTVEGPTTPADASGTPARIAIVCDPLFDEVIGAPCGGPAEEAWLRERDLDLVLLGTADGGARRVISFYGLR